MSKALCTFGVNAYASILDVSRPGFQAFAKKHGYDYIEEAPKNYKRPPAWGKVLVLRELLQLYSEVTWIDCDMLILDDSQDFAGLVPPDKIHAITAHTHFKEHDLGESPSSGLWYCTTHMLPWLDKIWSMTKYTNHVWWEQAALHELLGYTTDNSVELFPVRRVEDTVLYQQTHFLPVEWNSIEYYNLEAKARFMHFPMLTVVERIKEMERWLATRQNTPDYAEMLVPV